VRVLSIYHVIKNNEVHWPQLNKSTVNNFNSVAVWLDFTPRLPHCLSPIPPKYFSNISSAAL